MDNQNICSRCHKWLLKSKFMRKNYKNTGEIKQWKICNECNLNKLKEKVNKIDDEFNKKYNFISPYNNE